MDKKNNVHKSGKNVASGGAKKPLNTNLITIIVAAVAVAVLVALLVPTLITLNNQNNDIENFNKQIEDLKNQLAGLDNADGITAEELEEALGKIEIPDDGLTEDQVKDIIDAAIGALGTPDSGLTDEEIREIIEEALKGIDTGLTEDQIRDIITEALNGITPGLTEDQIKDIINDALKDVTPELTEEQIRDIINEALKDVNTGLTEEEIVDIINQILGKKVSGLKIALQAGGEYALTGNVSLDELNISKKVTSYLDLNGYTLTINGNWQIYGQLTIVNGDIIIDKPEEETDLYMYSGICVGDDLVGDGTLNLDGVNIICRRLWNIENVSNTTIENSKFIVEGGYGFADGGESTIKNCSMIANGVAATPLYTLGGKTNVIDTTFTEGTDFVSYYYLAPIEAHSNGEVVLEGVDVTTSADEYTVFAGTAGKVVVKSGSFNDKFICVGDTTSVSIYGGTIDGVAFADITESSEIFVGVGFKLTKNGDCWIISK